MCMANMVSAASMVMRIRQLMQLKARPEWCLTVPETMYGKRPYAVPEIRLWQSSRIWLRRREIRLQLH